MPISMQYDMLELKMDASHVISLIKHDAKFEGLLQKLKHQEAIEAVADAFNLLHSAPGPEEKGGQVDLTPDGCMVVALLQQLLIRLLTKRLMNLMSAEAIILNRNKIPLSYLENYLSNQTHFSLKKTISSCFETLNATIRYVSDVLTSCIPT